MKRSNQNWLQFLSVPSLRTGLYTLNTGTTDRQAPHDKDELYYVLEGQATITIDDQEHAISQGDVIYVAANAEHRFHDITEDLSLLVFFSEAEPEQ